jgi:hypothetical protein
MMIFFSERKELEKQYYEWIKANGVADQPNCVIAFLEINGLLQNQKIHEKAGIIKSKPTNFDKITSSADVLLDFLDKHTDFCTLDRCKECHDFNTIGCRECIRKWLQEECEE